MFTTWNSPLKYGRSSHWVHNDCSSSASASSESPERAKQTRKSASPPSASSSPPEVPKPHSARSPSRKSNQDVGTPTFTDDNTSARILIPPATNPSFLRLLGPAGEIPRSEGGLHNSNSTSAAAAGNNWIHSSKFRKQDPASIKPRISFATNDAAASASSATANTFAFQRDPEPFYSEEERARDSEIQRQMQTQARASPSPGSWLRKVPAIGQTPDRAAGDSMTDWMSSAQSQRSAQSAKIHGIDSPKGSQPHPLPQAPVTSVRSSRNNPFESIPVDSMRTKAVFIPGRETQSQRGERQHSPSVTDRANRAQSAGGLAPRQYVRLSPAPVLSSAPASPPATRVSTTDPSQRSTMSVAASWPLWAPPGAPRPSGGDPASPSRCAPLREPAPSRPSEINIRNSSRQAIMRGLNEILMKCMPQPPSSEALFTTSTPAHPTQEIIPSPPTQYVPELRPLSSIVPDSVTHEQNLNAQVPQLTQTAEEQAPKQQNQSLEDQLMQAHAQVAFLQRKMETGGNVLASDKIIQ